MKKKEIDVSIKINPRRTFIAICLIIFVIAVNNILLTNDFIIYKFLIVSILTLILGMVLDRYIIYYMAKYGHNKTFQELKQNGG